LPEIYFRQTENLRHSNIPKPAENPGNKNKKTIKLTNPAIYASEMNVGEYITSPLPVAESIITVINYAFKIAWILYIKQC